MVRENGSFAFNFPYTDHLGSILTVTNTSGAVIAEQNFDAWGRKRNVTTWDYANVGTVPDWLYRGYTGHEHLPEFGLINMNARTFWNAAKTSLTKPSPCLSKKAPLRKKQRASLF